MIKERIKVKGYLVKLFCAVCDGTMEFAGRIMKFPEKSPQFSHRCIRCGITEWITGFVYPYYDQ